MDVPKARIEQYDYQHVACVPFDFAEELFPPKERS